MSKRKQTETKSTKQGSLDSWLGVDKKKKEEDTSSDQEEEMEGKVVEKDIVKKKKVAEEEQEMSIDDQRKVVEEMFNIDLKSVEKSADFQALIMEPLAKRLMNEMVIVAGKVEHRITELEFYVNGHAHLDTFTHGDEQQRERAMWYFHRQNGGGYKTASYKGLDIAFGDGQAYAGILIRGVKALDVKNGLVDGPSLTVDSLLKAARCETIDQLVKENGRSLLPGVNKALFIRPKSGPYGIEDHNIIATGRVGLTMKVNRAGAHHYFAREYRFVALPDLIKKGKQYMTCALHHQGKTPDQIRAITRSTANAIKTCISAFDQGSKMTKSDISKFRKTLSNEDCCQLLGLCSKLDKEDDDEKDKENDQDDDEEEDDNDSEEQTDE